MLRRSFVERTQRLAWEAHAHTRLGWLPPELWQEVVMFASYNLWKMPSPAPHVEVSVSVVDDGVRLETELARIQELRAELEQEYVERHSDAAHLLHDEVAEYLEQYLPEPECLVDGRVVAMDYVNGWVLLSYADGHAVRAEIRDNRFVLRRALESMLLRPGEEITSSCVGELTVVLGTSLGRVVTRDLLQNACEISEATYPRPLHVQLMRPASHKEVLVHATKCQIVWQTDNEPPQRTLRVSSSSINKKNAQVATPNIVRGSFTASTLCVHGSWSLCYSYSSDTIVAYEFPSLKERSVRFCDKHASHGLPLFVQVRDNVVYAATDQGNVLRWNWNTGDQLQTLISAEDVPRRESQRAASLQVVGMMVIVALEESDVLIFNARESTLAKRIYRFRAHGPAKLFDNVLLSESNELLYMWRLSEQALESSMWGLTGHALEAKLC